LGWLAASALVLGSVALFALLPLAVIFRVGASSLFEELAEPATRSALGNTLIISILVTAVSVPLGSLMAWVVERTDALPTDRARARAAALLSLPLAIPPYLLAMAWALLANGRNGLVNRLFSHPIADVYGIAGIVLVLSSSAYPFALLAVRAMLVRADRSLEEAARTSGAGPVRVLIDVTLPLVIPAIAASSGLVFVFSAAAFGVPYLLGSAAEPPVAVLTTRIYHFTTLGGPGTLERAGALSLVLLAASVVAQGAAGWVARRRTTIQVSGKASRIAPLELGSIRPLVRALLAIVASVFVLLPIAAIAWTSLSKSFADPWALTGRHWTHVLGRSETVRAFSHSVALALGTGAIVAVAGVVIARTSKVGGRRTEWLASISALPYAVPGTVLAIGLILTFAREIRVVVLEALTLVLHLPGTLALLLVAYTVKYLAFGVRGARAALDQLHPSLEEAARISGAGPVRSAVDVVVPLIAPAIGAAFILAALPCLSELTMSVLLFGAKTETAGTLLFELQSYSDPPAGAVVATLVVIVAIAGDAIVRRFRPAR
jgi:iron(III) transport system permease protein